jgi:hypothetical protein
MKQARRETAALCQEVGVNSMLKSMRALAVTATLGLAALMASGTNSSASPVVLAAGQNLGDANIVEAANRRDRYGHGRRCMYPGCYSHRGYYGHRRHYGYGGYYAHRRHYGYGGYYGHRRYYPYGGYYFGFPFYFGGGFADRYYDDDYYGNYNYGGSAHVEWCSNRYRSYRPRTNTWTSYSGKVRRCISPYS